MEVSSNFVMASRSGTKVSPRVIEGFGGVPGDGGGLQGGEEVTADVEGALAVGAQEPLVPRHGVVVDGVPMEIERDLPQPLGAVDQEAGAATVGQALDLRQGEELAGGIGDMTEHH